MEQSSGKIILHIDFDSFFASVEQQYNPLLRNKPIGVTAVNGRNCIIAASREAKRCGIKTGTTRFEAYKVCPQIQLVSADFVKYAQISKKFLHICKYYSPLVEMFSIDEVFIDLTKTSHLFGGVYEVIKKIRRRIIQDIGEYITVSVGISHNRMLAKLASGFKKPNGLVEIKKEDVEKIFAIAKLTDICGIGERIRLRLNTLGIYNLLHLRSASLALLIQEFGKVEGHFLYRIGQGIDDSLVIPYTDPVDVKSVGRNYCLPCNQYSKRVVLQNIYELCEEIALKLRRLSKKSRGIGIYLHGNAAISGQRTFSTYTYSGKELFQRCNTFLGNIFMSSYNDYIRQISICAQNLENAKSLPLTLFEYNRKDLGLQNVIDQINAQFGDHTIRNGFLLYADKLTTVPNGYGADKWERTKLADEAQKLGL